MTKINPPAPVSDASHRSRFITAASLFDGHDAAINIMRRILQSSGAEVIHLGHNRSVAEVVQAAVQEDASAIALSSYQGGHVEYFKFVVDELKRLDRPHIKVFGGGGGTITPAEIAELEAYGVTKIYSPEDGRKMGLQGIINHMLELASAHPLNHTQWDKIGDYRTHSRALAEALTLIELGEEAFTQKAWKPHRPVYEQLCSQLGNQPGKGKVIGITGTGGAGKSSLTDELLLRFLAHDPGAKLAVLAIDPTRKKTGGALLGDRLRMNALASPRCFMRSFATREANVSISAATRQAVQLFKDAGFDWIFVETGGIGQADTSIVDLVDINLYVMTSEFGAPTQLEKINMLDYAHLVLLNKFDKKGSLDALTEVRRQYRRNHLAFEKFPPNCYPVIGTMASRFNDPGVNAAFQHLLQIAAAERAEERFRPLSIPFNGDGLESSAIVPTARTQYLAEIAREVRHYHQEVEQAAALAQRIQSYETVLADPLSAGAKQEVTQRLAQSNTDLPEIWHKQLNEFTRLSQQYRGENFTYQVRDKAISVPLTTKSLSGNAIRRVVPPRFTSRGELVRFIGKENLPGHFPFTAGVYPFKRSEEDPKRQFAGEGTPTRTNRRFHLLCQGEKAKRLSTAFDSVTLYGQDPDERPDIFGKIGESGVSVCTLEDAQKLYAGFDLCDPATSVSMTINGPAPILLAFYFNTAIEQQCEAFKQSNHRPPTEEERRRIQSDTLKRVRGTVQADILKEDQAQNTCIFSTDFALRMMGDIQQYFIDEQIRNYYSVSISGYHIAEAGANPISQLAFTLANGFTFAEYYLSRGMKIDDFAPNFSFFFSNGLDPEYTVIGRVARRIWAIAMRTLYKGSVRSQMLKYHIQTSGRSLHAQEISFNDIRTTLQALLAYFDNCNSLHTNAYDEAVTTPTEESVRRAMAIQLILAKEFGWAKNENPMQGSFLVEELTDLVEEAVLKEFERLSARGGVLGAMETQYQRGKIQEESLYYEQLKHSGELPLIGVNTYLGNSDNLMAELDPSKLTRASYAEKNEQIDHLRKYQSRHQENSKRAIALLKQSAQSGGNIFAALMQAARFASLGQLSQALYEIGGQYRRGM